MAVAAARRPAAGVRRPAYTGAYADLINRSARRNGLDPWLLAALLFVESHLNPHAKSATGDYGIAQINLAAHPTVTPAEALNPRFAIPWAARYLSELKRKTGSTSAALRAYNTGSPASSPAGSSYASHVLTTRRQAIRSARRPAAAGGLSGYAGVDQGVDFTGKGPIPVLAPGTITDVGTETDLEGQHGAYVIERLQNGQFVYVAENFRPTVHRGQKVRAGETLGINRGVTSQGTGIEIGYNRSARGWNPLAPLGSNPHGPTAAGQRMLAFLRRRGVVRTKAGSVVATGQPVSLGGAFGKAGGAITGAAGDVGGAISGAAGDVVGAAKGAYDTATGFGKLADRILTDPGYIFLWVGFALVGLAFIFLGVERLLGRSAGADARKAGMLVAAPEASAVGVAE